MKNFSLLVFIFFFGRVNAQQNLDSLSLVIFHQLEQSGDLAWAKHDTATAHQFYSKAWEGRAWENELKYRLQNIGDTSCKFDTVVNRFFKLYSDGKNARKDHCCKAADEDFRMGKAIALRPGYAQLKGSWYYEEVCREIKWYKHHHFC
ncbi:MAG TPA: hypothetical protein VL651_02175 [Bacteroidia bacterium]|jgi:hypothetical protein|nr:hypothetical protein [Bacteroidia bacterium]